MKFTDTDMEDFDSVIRAMQDLENSDIILEHAVFRTAQNIVFLVTYEDPGYQIEVQPSIPAEDMTWIEQQWKENKDKKPGQPKQMRNRQAVEPDAGWPLQ